MAPSPHQARTCRDRLPVGATVNPMADTSKVAKNLRAFQIGINAHDRENPTHTAYGIGLAHFDLERLGFDEGEEILPGITIHADDGETGNFRVLCDGDHLEEREAEEAEVVEAVATQTTTVPVGAPREDDVQSAGRRR
jgi:hypothetical protein